MSIVMCRVCREKFDKDKTDDWIMPSNRYYYHKNCYEKWKSGSDASNDEDWVGLIYDFIARDLKVQYNFHMCESQRENFIKKHSYTNKGIYFALKYFYEVKHNNWDKGNGGIGIIPFIYKESCTYWAQKEKQQTGILKMIEQQIKDRQEREPIVVRKTKQKKEKRGSYNLDDIMNGDLDDR